MGRVKGLVVSAAVLMCAAPAHAQLTPAQEDAMLDQMECIYHAISDDAVIALAAAYETSNNQMSDAVVQSVNAASEACQAKHGWDEHRTTMAYEATVSSSVVDVLMYDLEEAGMKDVDALFDIWDNLTDEDFEVLLADGWRQRPDFINRLRPTLIAAGVPDTDAAVAKSLTVFEAATYGSLLAEEWIVAASMPESGGAAPQ